MSITKKHFGTMPDGEEVFSYELCGKNIKAEILNYGGIIKNLWVKNAGGEYVDVVLGRDSLEEYLNNSGFYGAFVGRYANRIGDSKFSIGENEYTLFANNGKNSLHGGKKGFDKYVLKEISVSDTDTPSVMFEHFSPDGDEGYPGNLSVKLTYSVGDNDGLIIHYEAVSDKDTIINFTNHSYFNLNGAGNGNVYGHTLWMNCPFFTPNSKDCMPTGEILSVKDTPFDFMSSKKMGDAITSNHPQISIFGGFDHNFVIEGTGYRKFATLSGDESGIVMDCFTNKPGVQLYTGNGMNEKRICKNGLGYKNHGGLCLETQFFPNSMEYAHFPSPIFRAEEKYDYTTEYRFSAGK